MAEKWKPEEMDALIRAILSLETPEECMRFLEDLCTIKELQSMSQRFAVARMLSDKKVYAEVVEKTGASTATISRVNRCLQYGDSGYRDVIQRMKEHGV